MDRRAFEQVANTQSALGAQRHHAGLSSPVFKASTMDPDTLTYSQVMADVGCEEEWLEAMRNEMQ